MTAYTLLATLLLGGIIYVCITALPRAERQPVRIRAEEGKKR